MSPLGALALDTADWPLILSEAGPDGRTVAVLTDSEHDSLFGGDSAVDAMTALRYARLFQAAPELRESLRRILAADQRIDEDYYLEMDAAVVEARELLARSEDA